MTHITMTVNVPYLQLMTLINIVMKIVVKTLKKVVFEVSKNEMKNRGFDSIWDEIRESYPSEIYDLNIVDQNKKGLDLIFFELVSK